MKKISNDMLGRPTAEEFAAMPKLPLVVVLDNIRSTNNVGSFFRTADAFAVERIILCGITAQPPSKEIHKTALGAENTVSWEYYDDTCAAVDALHNTGYTVYAVEQVEDAVMLDSFRVDRSKKYAMVFGNEVLGVAQEVVDKCDAAIEIPQSGTKHSLNVAVSGGAVLWTIYGQLK